MLRLFSPGFPPVAVVLLLALATGIPVVAERAAEPPVERLEDAGTLEPGNVVQKEITGGQVHVFSVSLTEAQSFQVLVGARGLGLALTLKAPDGTAVVGGYTIYAGDRDQRLVWVAETAGRYTLEVRPPSIYATARSTYQLQLDELRLAHAVDKKRLEVQSLWLRARQLANSPDPERLQQALEHCQNGLAIARELDDPLLESRIFMLLAVVHYYRGALRACIESAEEARRRQVGRDPHGEADSLSLMGKGHMAVDEFQQALEEFERSLALYRTRGDKRGEAQVLTDLGIIYDSVNDYQKALELYREALPTNRAQGDRRNEARTLHNSATSLLNLDRLPAALETYEQALGVARAIEYRRGELSSLIGMAEVHHLLNGNDKALDELGRALPLARALGDQQFESLALKNRADALRDLGRHENALEDYRQAYAIAGVLESRLDQIEALLGASILERNRGNLGEARRLGENTARLIETLRGEIQSHDLRLSLAASVRRVYDLQVDVLMRLHARDPALGLDRAAFEASERGRLRTLLDMLQESKVDVSAETDPALAERAVALRREIGVRAFQMSLLDASAAVGSKPSLEQEIAELARQYDAVRNQIRKQDPRGSELSEPEPLSVGGLQASLDDETVVFEYQLGEDRSYLWAVTRGGLTSVELPKESEIDALARRVHQALTQRNGLAATTQPAERHRVLARAEDEYAQAASELSAIVLGRLPGPRAARIVIVADGVLHYMPFAALPLPSTWGPTAGPLIAMHEVVTLPSSSVVAALRSERGSRPPAPKQIAVFADPVFSKDDSRLQAPPFRGKARASKADHANQLLSVFSARPGNLNLFREGLRGGGEALPRLEDTRALADGILEGLPATEVLKAVDFQASREAVLSPSLGQYRTIVFATHGLLNTQYPELSGIALSMVNEKGEPQNGFLRLHDVYDLKLNADLVVLGACETGLGREIKGEGLVGLSRGFLYAGSARVLASLWKVDEMATMELLKELFRARRAGKSFPQALREAQLALRRHPRWRSPYFWAGFILQGDWT